MNTDLQTIHEVAEVPQQNTLITSEVAADSTPSLEGSVDETLDKAVAVASGIVDGVIDQSQHETRVSPLDELINYFADKGNYLAPDPEKIMSAGFTIAGYFDRIGHSGHADEGFEANLDRVVSAASALIGRDVALHKVRSFDDPLVSSAANLEFMARNIWADAKEPAKVHAVWEVDWDNPKGMMNNVREYTRAAPASKNPVMLQSYAELGSRTAKLIAAASEAGGQNRELDYVDIGSFHPETNLYTSSKGFSDRVSKDYINGHLHRTLESIRSAEELANV